MRSLLLALTVPALMALGDGEAPLEGAPWIGDGRGEPAGAHWYDEDPAPEFKAEFVLRPGVTNVTARFACAGYAQVFFRSAAGWLSGLEAPWSVYDKTVYSISTTRKVVPRAAAADVRPSMTVGEEMQHGPCFVPYPGTNVVTVRLGNGFYNLPPLRFWGHHEFRSVLAHGRPCFKLVIDGAERPLEWKWRRTNVLRNSVYLGAEVDATRPEDCHWRPAAEVQGPRGKIVPWSGRHWPHVNFDIAHGRPKWLRDGVQVVDFGTNATGVPTFRFRGEERGTRVEIVYGERLNPDGSVNVLTQTAGQIKGAGKGGPGAPDVACQRDVYVCRGIDEGLPPHYVGSRAKDEEQFTPPFTWHVFRYAEVRGAKNLLREDGVGACRCDISSVAVPLPSARNFKPRNSVFGDIHQICTRTFQANLIGAVQSDCPGRERLGYGGDIVATCEAYMLNWDMREIYLKILRDFADEAADDGWLTETAPFVGIATKGFGGRSGPISWTVAVPVLMDALIRHYPDVRSRALAFYPVCARYARLVDAKCPDGIVPQCIGDHEALERAPDAVTATAHWHQFTSLTAKFAAMLGRDADAREFAGIAAKTRSAFSAKFIRDGVVANGSQSAQAIALYLGLVPPEQVPAAERALVAAVEKTGCAPTTGIFGTRYLLMYLSEHGRLDLAERVVLHEGFPGWRHMLERGATTLWETWRESDDVYSNCHPMFGSVDEWILRYGR